MYQGLSVLHCFLRDSVSPICGVFFLHGWGMYQHQDTARRCSTSTPLLQQPFQKLTLNEGANLSDQQDMVEDQTHPIIRWARSGQCVKQMWMIKMPVFCCGRKPLLLDPASLSCQRADRYQAQKLLKQKDTKKVTPQSVECANLRTQR